MLGLGLGVDKNSVLGVEGYPLLTYSSNFSQVPQDRDGWDLLLASSTVSAIGDTKGRTDVFSIIWTVDEVSPWYLANTTAIPEISDQNGLGSVATISFDVLCTSSTTEEFTFSAFIGDTNAISGTEFTLNNNVVPTDDNWYTVTGTCTISPAANDTIAIGTTGAGNVPVYYDQIYFHNISVTVEDRS